MKAGGNKYSQIDTVMSHGIETMSPLGWLKKCVIMKYVVTVIPLVEFDICFLEVEYVNWQ